MKYFKESEFTMGGENVFDKMNKSFLIKLDNLREACDVPLVITSSFRSKEYNKSIHGAKFSMHLQGRAVDVVCTDSSNRCRIMKEALAMGLTIGVGRDFLHIDDRAIQIVYHYY